MDFDNSSFCALPFVHQEKFFVWGHNICCYSKQKQSDNDQQNSLESFNSQKIKQVRTAMLAGERPSECNSCYKFEDQGGHSPRHVESKAWINLPRYRAKLDHNIEQFTAGNVIVPSSYDLRYSTTCTLKCRMCNSGSSSSINQEYSKLQAQWPEKFWTLPNSRIDHNIDLTPNIEKIYLAGGEPLVEPLNLGLLQRLVEINPDVNLIINTSLNRLTDQWLDLLNQFTSLTLAVSLDGVGTVNDYIRNGSNFDTVMSNLERVRHHQILFTTCISIYNIFDVSNIVKHVIENFPESAKWHGINVVNDIEELFIDNVPPELRPNLIQELSSIVASESTQTGINNLIMLLQQDNFIPKRFTNFIKYTTILDNSRGESISDVVPKLAQYFDK